MFEIAHASYAAQRPLFAELTDIHGSVRAVIADPTLGRILVYDPEAPSAALLWGPEGLYLAGAPHPGKDYGDLAAAIEGWAYLYPSLAWQAVLKMLLPSDFRVRHPRVRLLAVSSPAKSKPLPQGYALEPLNEPLGFAIMHEGQAVSRCAADMVVQNYAEIGVSTHPDHRRRGLAHAVAGASLKAAFKTGITQVGWHCLASNKGSLALAKSLGFSSRHNYTAFSASLPAEAVGDLMAAECLALAQHFAQGAKQVNWLGFHAAVGWALAGERERALEAVEDLVRGGWAGDANWLENHWALQCLHDEPRFRAAIRVQRRR